FQRADLPPRRLSIARLLRAFRRMMRDYLHSTERGGRLRERLRHALIDPYHRQHKASRDYPRKKQESPPGPPHLRRATSLEIQQAQILRGKTQQKGVTA